MSAIEDRTAAAEPHRGRALKRKEDPRLIAGRARDLRWT